jgi:phosphatidylglycerophosphatase A
MKINFIEKLLGSGFYTGFIPFASGTFGSIAALIIYYIPGFEKPLVLIPAIFIFTFYGAIIGSKFEAVYGVDPPECTIDEVVGMWISLLFIPKSFPIVLSAFVIWRIMDIIKPFPAKQLEKIHGGWGIMLDDILAGFYSLLILHLIIFIFKL